jgi:hypothetical protein
MQRRGETSASKIVHFFSLFSTVLSRFVPGRGVRMGDRQWTFPPELLIMKKINHLGVIERVPFHFDSLFKLPLIAIGAEAVFRPWLRRP